MSISSKLVDIFGLKALCTKAWKKTELSNGTLTSPRKKSVIQTPAQGCATFRT